jgi:RNA polymerase sigma factor (sigma-70 family)
MSPDDSPANSGPSEFLSTSWTLVLAAGSTSNEGQAALDALCRRYWFPLYSFLRRRGHAHHEAEDLTQSFFGELLRRRDLGQAQREKGRFRSFLLTALKNHVSDEKSRDRAQKRGGGRKILPLDIQSAEARYSLEPAHDLTPERLFDRQWARTLIDQALVDLRLHYASTSQEKLFDALKTCLIDQENRIPMAQVAATLKMTEAAAKVASHRMRKRFGKILRSGVAATVANPEDVEDELRSLLASLRS